MLVFNRCQFSVGASAALRAEHKSVSTKKTEVLLLLSKSLSRVKGCCQSARGRRRGVQGYCRDMRPLLKC
jgi:hypothetical protein